MSSTTPLLDILCAYLPSTLSSTQLSTLSSRSAVETLLSFALGGECPTPHLDLCQEWSRNQPAALTALQNALKTAAGTKRRRDDIQHTNETGTKRLKTTRDDDDGDLPRFTLPSISTTSPIRKKVNVTVHARSIQFVNPNTRVLEASVPLASISRAFLLPTRGKTKGHWTVVLLPTDVPDKAKASPFCAQQIIFGLDALSAAPFDTTSYAYSTTTPSSTTTTVAKGEETASSVRHLLSLTHVPLLEPSATVFRSACATAKAGEGAAGINAYLSAKPGTLWFFDTGILWGESKPCEFWAVSDLAAKDGVRLLSATGRTCSVILRRRSEDPGHGAEEADGDTGGTETAFSMVDGREQDPINAWAWNRKHLFGKASAVAPISASVHSIQMASRSNGALPNGQQQSNGTIKGPAWDDSDSDDEDFEATSEDLEHSSSSESEESDGSEGGCLDEGAGAEESETGDDKEEEEEELEEAHHPSPRMSQRAVTLVDLTHDDASEEEDELEE